MPGEVDSTHWLQIRCKHETRSKYSIIHAIHTQGSVRGSIPNGGPQSVLSRMWQVVWWLRCHTCCSVHAMCSQGHQLLKVSDVFKDNVRYVHRIKC